MRTKSVFRLVDTITWLLISLAPLLIYGCMALGYMSSVPDFWSYCESWNSHFTSGLFGTFVNDVLSFINVNLGSFTSVFAWFVMSQVIHFIVDVLLWIFRLCHHWLNKAVDNL